MNRILVIRGGAIGDFVLTLPAIKLLRDRFPKAHLEILGYKHIAALAEKRFYADAVRSIESASLARFFAKNSELPGELADYFGGFDLILSYLYDPDRIFETNVTKSGRGTFISGPSRLDNSEHAALQLARPLAALGLSLSRIRPRIFSRPMLIETPSEASGELRENDRVPSRQRQRDQELADRKLDRTRRRPPRERDHSLMIIAGEADTARTRQLKLAWEGKPVRFAENLPLPHLAALLEGSVFVGHDSGISHIAAAVGARCLLLFGPTDPAIWAPANANVTVLRAPEGKMELLEVETVAAALRAARE